MPVARLPSSSSSTEKQGKSRAKVDEKEIEKGRKEERKTHPSAVIVIVYEKSHFPLLFLIEKAEEIKHDYPSKSLNISRRITYYSIIQY